MSGSNKANTAQDIMKELQDALSDVWVLTEEFVPDTVLEKHRLKILDLAAQANKPTSYTRRWMQLAARSTLRGY